MKTFLKNHFSAISLCGVLFSLIQPATAASDAEKTNAPAAKTNAVVEIPKSVFNDKSGKDPFFPRRTRVAAYSQPTTRAVGVSDFVLKGITKGAKTTCIINDRTFEKNETGEVKTLNGGRARVVVLEIKDDSVVIKIEDSAEPVVLQSKRGQF